ncbi:uncharacterized protein LOC107487135 [Arachis duranensis]|uniref:Uncharacterized protein LOC107487135 n=1 Tax=Arachis duranensis TaxID=130453 RepID=A0A6P4DDB5_ARADU|nr:uncharacterized protein LOC107487135 [Arachis duranensis]
MMQRWLTKLRTFAVNSPQSSPPLTPIFRCLIHHAPPLQSLHHPASSNLTFTSRSLFNFSSSPHFSFSRLPSRLSPLSPSLVQVRHVSSRERKLKRKPMTPVTSKIKKTKMKSYSSYKLRFRTLKDGTIRRWHEGKRHNAHLKSKKSKRRLRKPATVPVAYAKVMKKLSFCG